MNTVFSPSALCVHAGWLEAARTALRSGKELVLMTVVRALGSTPRDAGARMWLDEAGVHATIGGGHLELQAIQIARAMLYDAQGPKVQVRHFALGPSLGQCCGGAVWLAFERLGAADLVWCDTLHSWLLSGVSARRTRRVPVLAGASQQAPIDDLAVKVSTANGPCTQPDAWWNEADSLLEDLTPASAPLVVVCGAGHVGKALVRVLAELPVRVAWLDPREDEWPQHVPDNVFCINGDASDVDDFPDDAYWLVLTHSHALDLEIIERVLGRKQFSYLGLIGSNTKRARFRARLLRKFPAEQVDRMTCPIGLVETSSKLPGVIAVSVAAQIVSLLEHTVPVAEPA